MLSRRLILVTLMSAAGFGSGTLGLGDWECIDILNFAGSFLRSVGLGGFAGETLGRSEGADRDLEGRRHCFESRSP